MSCDCPTYLCEPNCTAGARARVQLIEDGALICRCRRPLDFSIPNGHGRVSSTDCFRCGKQLRGAGMDRYPNLFASSEVQAVWNKTLADQRRQSWRIQGGDHVRKPFGRSGGEVTEYRVDGETSEDRKTAVRGPRPFERASHVDAVKFMEWIARRGADARPARSEKGTRVARRVARADHDRHRRSDHARFRAPSLRSPRRGVRVEDRVNALLHDALWLAKGGLPVFPCAAKAPRTEHGFKDASRDPEQITAWWTKWPAANIGMPTGKVSRLVALDVDVHGANGFDTLLELGHELPITVSTITGGGGEHHLFRHPGGIKSGTDKLGPGLDIRAEGGYIILPPSVHESGRRYEWDHVPGETPFAPLPEWIATAVAPRPAGKPVPPSEWRELAGQAVLEGHRTTTLCRFVGHLLAKDTNVDVALHLMHAWNQTYCKPALPESKVRETVAGIAKREAKKRWS